MSPLPRFLVAGEASGPVVVLSEPLSFWGGFDAESGTVVDQRHPQVGTCLTAAIVLMPSGRGSSSASSVLAEAIRAKSAPAAIVLLEADEIIALGAIVADELYGQVMPVVVVDRPSYDRFAASRSLHIRLDGTIDAS